LRLVIFIKNTETFSLLPLSVPLLSQWQCFHSNWYATRERIIVVWSLPFIQFVATFSVGTILVLFLGAVHKRRPQSEGLSSADILRTREGGGSSVAYVRTF